MSVGAFDCLVVLFFFALVDSGNLSSCPVSPEPVLDFPELDLPELDFQSHTCMLGILNVISHLFQLDTFTLTQRVETLPNGILATLLSMERRHPRGAVCSSHIGFHIV